MLLYDVYLAQNTNMLTNTCNLGVGLQSIPATYYVPSINDNQQLLIQAMQYRHDIQNSKNFLPRDDVESHLPNKFASSDSIFNRSTTANKVTEREDESFRLTETLNLAPGQVVFDCSDFSHRFV